MVDAPRISSTEDGSNPDPNKLSKARTIAHTKEIASFNLTGVDKCYMKTKWEKTLRAPPIFDDFWPPGTIALPPLKLRRRLTISLA